MKCEKCGEELFRTNALGVTFSTCVGYFYPEGHNHDDNCRIRTYTCKNNHVIRLSKRNRCPSCSWVGKEECFCHEGSKLDEWPKEAT